MEKIDKNYVGMMINISLTVTISLLPYIQKIVLFTLYVASQLTKLICKLILFSSPTLCFRTKTIISCRTSHFLLQTIIFYSSQIFILKGRRTAVRNADFQPMGAAKKAQERNVFSFQFLFDEFPFRRDKYNSPDRTQLFRATGY